MDFDLNEEQTMLRDLIQRYGSDHYDQVRRLAALRLPKGFSEDNWRRLIEWGVPAFNLSEEFGGFSGGPVTIMTVLEAFGRDVVLEPLLPFAVLGAGFLDKAGTAAQKAAVLAPYTTGEAFPTLAHFEKQNRFDHLAVETTARQTDHGTAALTGAKHMVMAGSYATHFIVSARVDGEGGGDLGFFLVAADADGIERVDYRLLDGSVASDLRFNAVAAERLAGGLPDFRETVAEARLAISAELVGLMGAIFDATLDYVKTRQQFGQPLGGFQVIQHRMAENYTRLELAKSQLFRMAVSWNEPGERDKVIAGAKTFISRNAVALAEDAIQLHGGIGITEELMIGQAFRRVLLLARLFGDSDWELRRYNDLVRQRGSEPAACSNS